MSIVAMILVLASPLQNAPCEAAREKAKELNQVHASWQKPHASMLSRVAVAPNGALALVGHFDGMFTMNENPFNTNGGYDLFVGFLSAERGDLVSGASGGAGT